MKCEACKKDCNVTFVFGDKEQNCGDCYFSRCRKEQAGKFPYI